MAIRGVDISGILQANSQLQQARQFQEEKRRIEELEKKRRREQEKARKRQKAQSEAGLVGSVLGAAAGFALGGGPAGAGIGASVGQQLGGATQGRDIDPGALIQAGIGAAGIAQQQESLAARQATNQKIFDTIGPSNITKGLTPEEVGSFSTQEAMQLANLGLNSKKLPSQDRAVLNTMILDSTERSIRQQRRDKLNALGITPEAMQTTGVLDPNLQRQAQQINTFGNDILSDINKIKQGGLDRFKPEQLQKFIQTSKENSFKRAEDLTFNTVQNSISNLGDLPFEQRLEALQAGSKTIRDIGTERAIKRSNEMDKRIEKMLNTRSKDLSNEFTREALSLGFTPQGMNSNQIKAVNDSLAVKKSGAQSFQKESGLRQEYIKQSKNFFDVRDAFGRIKASTTDPSASGDISLIFNFMKMLDPTSTVREGEFATVQNSGSVDDRFRNTYNKLLSGERLSENQRNDFEGRSSKLFDSAINSQRQTADIYTDLASRNQLNPDNVVPNRELFKAPETKATLTADALKNKSQQQILELSDQEINQLDDAALAEYLRRVGGGL